MKFSASVSVICICLSLLFCRLSYWQWERYIAKQDVVSLLQTNIAKGVVPFPEIIALAEKQGWAPFIHRRVSVQGEFDYSGEVILRNRRLHGIAGAHVITPLRLGGSGDVVLVNRGFIPLEFSKLEERARYRKDAGAAFTGLVKESMTRRWLAPADPESGPGNPRVDAWLRVDLSAIGRQLPYRSLPIYLEILETSDAAQAVEEVVAADASGRDELLSLTHRGMTQTGGMSGAPAHDYPVPTVNRIIPASRHLSYVYEWLILAAFALAIGVVLQIDRHRGKRSLTVE
jgi:cytochrome oxidase assembly protein ShyY1